MFMNISSGFWVGMAIIIVMVAVMNITLWSLPPKKH